MFRISMYGIQIAKYGKIVNYGEANSLWEEIKSIESSEWSDYNKIFKKRLKISQKEFRSLTPNPVKELMDQKEM